MSALATLIKLQKTFVDEQRQLLAVLQNKLDEIERDIAELELRKTVEQAAAQDNPESRQTYGAFLKEAIRKGRELDLQRRGTLAVIEDARDKLAELFEEQKRYEIAEAARIANEEKEEQRRERIDLDEVGSVSFTRKKGE